MLKKFLVCLGVAGIVINTLLFLYMLLFSNLPEVLVAIPLAMVVGGIILTNYVRKLPPKK